MRSLAQKRAFVKCCFIYETDIFPKESGKLNLKVTACFVFMQVKTNKKRD